ncbi:hypothetical protein AVEN_142311-1, partial [Araneus ventricosus]
MSAETCEANRREEQCVMQILDLRRKWNPTVGIELQRQYVEVSIVTGVGVVYKSERK